MTYEQRKRNKYLFVRLSSQEKKDLEERAEKEDMTLAAFVRWCLFGN